MSIDTVDDCEFPDNVYFPDDEYDHYDEQGDEVEPVPEGVRRLGRTTVQGDDPVRTVTQQSEDDEWDRQARRHDEVEEHGNERAAASMARRSRTVRIFGDLPDESKLVAASKMKLTDFGLAARIALHFEDTLAWVTTMEAGYWSYYNGKHWENDPTGVRAAQVCRTVISSVSEQESAFATQSDSRVLEAEKRAKKLSAAGAEQKMIDHAWSAHKRAVLQVESEYREFGGRAENGTTHINAALEAAKTLLSIPLSEYNRSPYLLNVQNGTIDVRSGVLRPHDPADRITLIAAVDYIPRATHEDLDKALAGLARNDTGLPLYMQRYLGSMTTGLHCKSFLYIWGEANAGKTSLIEAAILALGDPNGYGYAAKISPKVFTLKGGAAASGENASPAMHKLMDKHGVFMDESAAGFPDVEVTKIAASGGLMTTRTLHGKPISWRSKLKIIFAGNKRMAMPTDDAGIEERLTASYLPVNLATYEGGKHMDSDLDMRLRDRAQLEAILAWLVEGGHDWLAEGATKDALRITPLMHAEKAAYTGSMDPLEDFFDDCVQIIDESQPFEPYLPLKTTTWRSMYVTWCKSRGVPEMPARDFADALTKRGFPARQTTRKVAGVSYSGKLRLGMKSYVSDAKYLEEHRNF